MLLAKADKDEKNSRRPNPIDIHVGGRVRMRRMLLGMSQEKLGELLGLTFQQIQKYEKGTNRIGASRLFELSRILAVPVQYFYDEAPMIDGAVHQNGFAEHGETGTEYVVDFVGSREGIELNRAFLRISSAKVRRSIVDLVRSLADDETDARQK
jgi:transcriptional regulator with XRE-family HTH domain